APRVPQHVAEVAPAVQAVAHSAAMDPETPRAPTARAVHRAAARCQAGAVVRVVAVVVARAAVVAAGVAAAAVARRDKS
ncbi:MAG TPA: hypothetical protein VN326_01545, partial [Casimicrobiaceae bacterium]|nr:hypothetical protein [Casimicrobiaceae bacterium]